MKKDYIPVTEDDFAQTEADFIEQHWARIWSGKHSISLAERIEKQEEFRMMKPVLSELPGSSRILDGGCGLGDWTLYLISKGYSVVGMDICRATIKRLKERSADQNFLEGDIRNTGFENDSFDLYFSWGTFEHFENGLGNPLREARRILKVGGYLLISVPFQNGRHLLRDNRQLWRWDENYDKDKGYLSKMRFYQWRLTKPELQRELEINGFKTLKIEAIHKRDGLYRAIRHDFNVRPDGIVGKIMRAILYPVVPRTYISHMLIAVSQKV